MDSDASQVAAVSRVPTGSARPVATNSARAVHQLKSPDSKEDGMRRSFVTRGNSKDKPLSKLETKDERVLDENSRSGWSICQPKSEDRKRGLRRLFQTKLNINEKSDPKLGNKVNVDLNENSRSGKVKKSKTKMDTTKDDERVPLPGAKVHTVYLTSDPIEDDEAALAYHKNFLENVFGSRASEIIIAYSCTGIVNSFIVWLTDEEVAVLSGCEEVIDVEYNRRKLYYVK